MDRRQIVANSVGLVGMSLLMPMLARATTLQPDAVAVPSSAGGGGFDPVDPVQNAEVLARMNLGLGHGTHYGWFKGRIFAVIGDEQVIQPLFDLEGFGANHINPLGGARFQSLHREVGYYKDLHTGEIMERWKNPFIDEVVTVSQIHNDPVNSVIGPVIEAKLGSGMIDKFPLRLPWTMMGDLAMTSFDVNTRWKNVLDAQEWPRESSGTEYVRVSEYLQFFVNRADLNNWRSMDRILTHGCWERIATWLPWMFMGNRPGHLFYRSFTKSLPTLQDLPQDIRKYTESNYPRFLEAPETWIEPNVSSFEVYKNEHKPVGAKPG